MIRKSSLINYRDWLKATKPLVQFNLADAGPRSATVPCLVCGKNLIINFFVIDGSGTIRDFNIPDGVALKSCHNQTASFDLELFLSLKKKGIINGKRGKKYIDCLNKRGDGLISIVDQEYFTGRNSTSSRAKTSSLTLLLMLQFCDKGRVVAVNSDNSNRENGTDIVATVVCSSCNAKKRTVAEKILLAGSLERELIRWQADQDRLSEELTKAKERVKELELILAPRSVVDERIKELEREIDNTLK